MGIVVGWLMFNSTYWCIIVPMDELWVRDLYCTARRGVPAVIYCWICIYIAASEHLLSDTYLLTTAFIAVEFG